MSEENSLYEWLGNLQLENKSDIIIAIVHWFLMQNNFRCLGTGYTGILQECEDPNGFAELPPQWNEDHKKFNLKYIRQRKVFALLACKYGDDFIRLCWMSGNPLIQLNEVHIRFENVFDGTDEDINRAPDAGQVLNDAKLMVFQSVFS